MKRLSMVILMVSLLTACATVKQPPEHATSTGDIIFDEKLIETAKRLDGFGGMFFDDDGNLNVYLLEGDQRLSMEALKARRAQIQTTLSEVFGEDLLTQRRIQRSELEEKPLPKKFPEIKIIKGDYEIQQLARWRASANRVLEIPGVVFTDLDEGQNRVTIGIESNVPREPIETILRKLGVPRKAVIIEETKPIRFQRSLRDKFRPVPGGVQVEADTCWFYYNICTMGFNALRGSIKGFVTNSHCTKTMGSSQGTDFHQPDDPWWHERNKVGDEIDDPAFFTGGDCPTDSRCRYSDSAFIKYSAYDARRGKDIARTTGWNNGSLTIDSNRPILRIVGEASTLIDGSYLDKIGRTTGWTYGRVNGTCLRIHVYGTDITLLCQSRVNRLQGQTYTMSDEGDSGSPVFIYRGSDAILSGILWGGPGDGSSFVFSPIAQIEHELGSFTTFNFPPPPPCPTGKKCCGFIEDNKCVGLCWPRDRPCP